MIDALLHRRLRLQSPSTHILGNKTKIYIAFKKIAFKDSQIIWYTGCDRYTPDLLIGKTLIVEVDGKVHDKDFQKTPDRIRQRALEKIIDWMNK